MLRITKIAETERRCIMSNSITVNTGWVQIWLRFNRCGGITAGTGLQEPDENLRTC